MHHATPLITTIVGGLVLAFILGMLANKLRISPLVGYLLAGVLAGPFTPGFVADTKLAPELAELGVILLMFGVGLHFSLKDFLKPEYGEMNSQAWTVHRLQQGSLSSLAMIIQIRLRSSMIRRLL